MDFGKVDTDLVDLQCFPEMIYGHNLTCDTEALVFEFAIIDDCYLLPSTQCCKDNLKIDILGLTNLLKTDPDMGIVCTDSCECFDSNREYLRRRAVEESNPKVKALLEMDRDMLTRMQAEMANAREFYLVKRYTGLKPEMVFA